MAAESNISNSKLTMLESELEVGAVDKVVGAVDIYKAQSTSPKNPKLSSETLSQTLHVPDIEGADCHRDLKPQNILVDPLTHQVKLCDFGSAKVLVRGEANIAYICSRFYRAPELIFGATEYTTAIDIWSAALVPWRKCSGSTCSDNQGSWHPNKGGNSLHEPQLHGF